MSSIVTSNNVSPLEKYDFINYSCTENSTNFINCDGPLYHFIECNGSCSDDIVSSSEYDSEISTAVKSGRIDLLDTLNVTESYFYYACKFNNPDIIRWFISKFSNLDLNFGLEVSCIYDTSNNATVLIESGADVNIFDGRPIILCSLNNSYETLKILVYNDVDISNFNDMAFVLACENGNIDIVKLLVERGCNIHSTGEYNEEELDEEELNEYRDIGFKLACKNGHKDVVILLLNLGIDINRGFNEVCEHGDIDLVKFFIERDADISKSLVYASRSDNLELVKYLLSIGVKLNFVKNDELRYAEKMSIISFLIDQGSKPDAKMICDAIYFNHMNKAKLLIQNYNGNETFDDELRLLISNDKLDGIKVLLDNIDIDCKNSYEYALSINRLYGYTNKRIIALLKEHCK